MPKYTADPSKDSAGFPVFPKGDYRLKIGEPKAFEQVAKRGPNTGKTSYGIGFLVTCVNGAVNEDGTESNPAYVGKKQYHKMYQHTQGAKDFGKGFLLSAFGYTLKEEDAFNAKASELDWSFDTDSGEVGEGWKSMTHAELVATMSVNIDNETKQEIQQFESFRPIPTGEKKEEAA